MKRLSLILMAAGVIVMILAAYGTATASSLMDDDPIQMEDPGPEPPAEPVFDHSQFEILQGPFESPQDLTKACLSCHEDAADEVQHTIHWTWEFIDQVSGETYGKKTLLNNFCIGIESNEPRCTSCHVGYGWADDSFDFSASENVDCLVCHDTTGTYKKFPTASGYPVSEPTTFNGVLWEPPDLSYIAMNVGFSSRDTCGSCHFYGGGGDEVKHGDLDSSLIDPDFELDVHMDSAGLNYSCTTCHETTDHDIPGSRYSMDLEQWQGCETCHTDSPHEFEALNDHTDRIACETCHIPEYARGDIATKMFWDWSTAGQFDENGKPITLYDDDGNISYTTQKGDFIWEENVTPDYVWFNGSVSYTTIDDVINPTEMVSINSFNGDINDPNARIWPVKRFVGIQPYDSGNNTLVVPHLFGGDEFAYWKNYDWDNAIQYGMEVAGQPYSGQYGFVETEMFWPITHMVAPADQALTCQDCHTEENSRMDFSALGYTEAEAHRLTNFPPTLSIESKDIPTTSPDYCAQCHTDDLTDEQVKEMVSSVEQMLMSQQAEGDIQLSEEELYAMAHSMTDTIVEGGGQYEIWAGSVHAEVGVGCISCHKLEDEGEHPLAAYSVDQSAEVCGACHLDEYRDWEDSRHAEPGDGKDPITCVACHEPHAQELRKVGDNPNACVNCHHDQTSDVTHSTHTAAGLECLDCHKNDPDSTGHSFNVASKTCILCHAEDIHDTARIIELGGTPELIGAAETIDALNETQGTLTNGEASLDEQAAQGAVIGVPLWTQLIAAIIVGAVGTWVVIGKEPKTVEFVRTDSPVTIKKEDDPADEA